MLAIQSLMLTSLDNSQLSYTKGHKDFQLNHLYFVLIGSNVSLYKWKLQ